MIKIVFFDIDGVLTSGHVWVDEFGHELKKYQLTEIDAINDIKQSGRRIVAITGEETPIVDVFEKRVKWDLFIKGSKNKAEEVRKIIDDYGISREEACYIGDGKYDISAIEYVGLGVCPSNAINEAKNVADIVLKGSGGENCISELYSVLRKMDESKEVRYDR